VKRHISLILVALLAVGGIATVPATAANAAGGTTVGVIKVQLLKPNGDNFYKKGFVVTANGMTKDVYKEAKTNSAGVGTLRVPPGKYTISVVPYRATSKTGYRYAVNSQDYIAISRGQVKTIGLKMYVGAQVTGKVLTTTGFALKGAQVAAVTRKGLLVGLTTADKKGKYKLAGLPTGKVTIIFNYRSYDDGKSKVVANYSSAFYKGTSLADAKYLQVYQQNKFAKATKTTGVSGPVVKGTTLNVTLSNTVNAKTSRLLVDHISAKGSYMSIGSIYAPFAGGTSAKVRIGAGKYRLGITVAGVSYYYAGYGMPPTRSVSKAQLTYFDGVTPVYVQFGPLP
jgi:hypothetical protein